MTPPFTLDENIIILAQKGENVLGERDTTCLDLIREIADNRHTLVLAESFWATYHAQVKGLERQRVLLQLWVMGLLEQRVIDPDGTIFVLPSQLVEIPGLDVMPNVDEGDRMFVRAGRRRRARRVHRGGGAARGVGSATGCAVRPPVVRPAPAQLTREGDAHRGRRELCAPPRAGHASVGCASRGLVASGSVPRGMTGRSVCYHSGCVGRSAGPVRT